MIKSLLTIDPKKRLSVEEVLNQSVFLREEEYKFKNKEQQKEAFVRLKKGSQGLTLEENC